MKYKTLWSLIPILLTFGMLLVGCGADDPAAVSEPEQETAATVETVAEGDEDAEPAATTVAESGGSTSDSEPAEPKILRIRNRGDIQNLDPAFILGSVDDTIDWAVFNGLVRYAANSYELVNDLAEWIETSEDGLEIRFKLHEGVMWQGGYGELTTEDVKFSFERFLDPELASPYADDWAALDHVEVIDKYEGKIVLKEPSAALWSTTLPVTSGSIICKKQVEEIGLEKFATQIIGSGPYIFDTWKPNERLILVRNPEYWGEAPYWDEIHFIPIEDDKAAEVALEAGEVDFGEISLASIDRFESDPSYELLRLQSLRYGWIGMNVENPKLQDINVRQAIRYGIDVPSILMATYMGQAEQAKTMLPAGMLGYWDDAPLYQRDVEKARQYLAAAGVETLDLELAIEDNTEFRTWAEVVQQNLAEIGINITISSLDPSTFWVLGEGDQGKDVELFTMMYSAQPDPAWFTMWFVCDQVGVWNWQRWCEPRYDELHEQGLVTIDREQRNQIYIEMEQLWDAAAHSVWITHPPTVYAHTPGIAPATTPNGKMQVHLFGATQ